MFIISFPAKTAHNNNILIPTVQSINPFENNRNPALRIILGCQEAGGNKIRPFRPLKHEQDLAGTGIAIFGHDSQICIAAGEGLPGSAYMRTFRIFHPRRYIVE
jgi:hypothetical protein